jgi:hypothetical protein
MQSRKDPWKPEGEKRKGRRRRERGNGSEFVKEGEGEEGRKEEWVRERERGGEGE